MVDTEMTATPTQQPRIKRDYSQTMRRMQAGEKLTYTDKEVELIMLGWQSELDKANAARQEAQAMAECLDMLRTDLIAAGVVGPEVAPMFLTEAVLSEVSLERTARIEAQVRLADMQELAAKAGLAYRMAVQRCVQEAVAEAVTAEREACEERVVSLFEVLETPYLPDITRAIHARDKA